MGCSPLGWTLPSRVGYDSGGGIQERSPRAGNGSQGRRQCHLSLNTPHLLSTCPRPRVTPQLHPEGPGLHCQEEGTPPTGLLHTCSWSLSLKSWPFSSSPLCLGSHSNTSPQNRPNLCSPSQGSWHPPSQSHSLSSESPPQDFLALPEQHLPI